MTNQINKNSSSLKSFFENDASGFAFVKKEIHTENNFNTDVFTVYGSDGTLLAAFDNKDTAIAAIMQSGLQYMSLH